MSFKKLMKIQTKPQYYWEIPLNTRDYHQTPGTTWRLRRHNLEHYWEASYTSYYPIRWTNMKLLSEYVIGHIFNADFLEKSFFLLSVLYLYIIKASDNGKVITTCSQKTLFCDQLYKKTNVFSFLYPKRKMQRSISFRLADAFSILFCYYVFIKKM